MVNWFEWIVRFLHIGAGVFWIGGALLWSGVIMPTVTQKVPPPARGPFIATMGPIITRVLTWAGVVTILSGIWNMANIAGGWSLLFSAFQGGTWGMTLGIALVIAIVMLGIVHAAVIPAMNEMIELMRKMAPAPGAAPPPPGAAPPAPPPRMAELGQKLKVASMISMALAVTVIGLMAYAVKVRAG